MILKLVNILYVLIAIAMIGLILLQRGAGAAAGSGFGAGASGTVFGARGASNFLSQMTKWLAVAFFSISLGMAVYASRSAHQSQVGDDLGVVGALVTEPAPASEVPIVTSASDASEVPAGDALPASEGASDTSAVDDQDQKNP